jgi:hypothetical protein
VPVNVPELLRAELDDAWRAAGRGALTVLRSQVTGKIVVMLTDPAGNWNALALTDADAVLVRDRLDALT